MGIAALFLFLIMPVLAAVLACLCAGLVAVWMALRRTETQTATLLMLAAHLAEPAFSTGWVLLWALNAKAPPGWPPSVTAALGSITLALLALPVLGLASSHAIHRKQAGMLLGLGLVRGCLYAGTYYGGFARGNAGPLFLSVLGLAMALWASATVGVLQLTASRERPPRPAHGVVRPVEEIVIEGPPWIREKRQIVLVWTAATLAGELVVAAISGPLAIVRLLVNASIMVGPRPLIARELSPGASFEDVALTAGGALVDAVFAAAAATGLGLIQAAVLRRCAPSVRGWVRATAVGSGLASFAAIAIHAFTLRNLLVDVTVGAVKGALVGMLQARTLRVGSTRADDWILANVASGAAVAGLISFANPSQDILASLVLGQLSFVPAALVQGAVTGYILARHLSIRSEGR